MEYQRLELEKENPIAKDNNNNTTKDKKSKEKSTNNNNKKQTKGPIEVVVFNADKPSEQQLTTAQLVGKVWEYARNLGEFSVSNRIAISQELKLYAQLVQDAYGEANQLIQGNESMWKE